MDNIIINYLRTIMRLKLEKFLIYNLKMDYYPELKDKDNVIIYGAGHIGKLLLRCFDRKPIAFIDAKKGLNDICGVPIFHLDDCEYVLNENTVVIVTPVWDFNEIKTNLLKYRSSVTVISLEKLVEKL